MGINHSKMLIGKKPFELYQALCERSGKRHDPCVIDIFMLVVHFMEGGDPLPWWSFTESGKSKAVKIKRDWAVMVVTVEITVSVQL